MDNRTGDVGDQMRFIHRDIDAEKQFERSFQHGGGAPAAAMKMPSNPADVWSPYNIERNERGKPINKCSTPQFDKLQPPDHHPHQYAEPFMLSQETTFLRHQQDIYLSGIHSNNQVDVLNQVTYERTENMKVIPAHRGERMHRPLHDPLLFENRETRRFDQDEFFDPFIGHLSQQTCHNNPQPPLYHMWGLINHQNQNRSGGTSSVDQLQINISQPENAVIDVDIEVNCNHYNH